MATSVWLIYLDLVFLQDRSRRWLLRCARLPRSKYTGDLGAGWLRGRQHEREFEQALKVLFEEELQDKANGGKFCEKKFAALLEE